MAQAQGFRPFSVPTGAAAQGFYAGFWRRVAASLIDGIIFGIPLTALTWTLDDTTGGVISSLVGIAYQTGFLATQGVTFRAICRHC